MCIRDRIDAVQKDGLTWKNHVALFDSNNNKAASDYRITGIPMSFLVNREGIIVAENLRGAKLEQMVKETLMDNWSEPYLIFFLVIIELKKHILIF